MMEMLIVASIAGFWILDFATEITRRFPPHVFQSRRILDFADETFAVGADVSLGGVLMPIVSPSRILDWENLSVPGFHNLICRHCFWIYFGFIHPQSVILHQG
jgi:hypothetical protein